MRLRLCRPRSLDDYRKLEANSLQWDSPWNFTYSVDWFSQPDRSQSDPASFWKSEYDRTGGKLNPDSRNWCNWLLLDDHGEIQGRHFAAGVTKDFKIRHLNTDEEAPIFPIQWSDLIVPNPAKPETGRFGLTQLLVNFKNPDFAGPIVKTSAWFASFFRTETLFTQLICDETDKSAAIISKKYGLRKVRSLPSFSPIAENYSGRILHFEIWVWERDSNLVEPFPHTLSDLPEPLEAVQPLARFYQSLSSFERQILVRFLKGLDRASISDQIFLTVKRVDQGIASIRDKLIEFQDELEMLGLVLEATKHLSTLLFPLSPYLNRLAWFYGDDEIHFNRSDQNHQNA